MEKFDFDDMKYIAIALPEEIKMYKYSGNFEEEIKCIDRWIDRGLSKQLVKRLEFERKFAKGLMSDYNVDEQKIIDSLKEKYGYADKDLIDELIERGNVDFIMKNGSRMFQRNALSNIINTNGRYLHNKFNPMNTIPPDSDDDFFNHLKIMKEKGSRAYRFTVEHVARPVNCGEHDGKQICVWLPFPVECETQSEIKLISSSSPVSISTDKMGCAYFEEVYHDGDEYRVRFSYVNRAIYREPSADEVRTGNIERYTEELFPHISFTPYIRLLVDEIVGDELNPLIRARKIYDWITYNIKYSYLRDYLYIENISEFVALNGYGDCGAMSLLFITLCRCAGIPAKWQSGNSVRPDGMGSHDWCMFYIEPFGWLYCDPSYGVGAVRNHNEEKRVYYFANLDPFRCVTCNDFQIQLSPKKNFLRMDPYDNQNGEAEFFDYNIFFDKFEFSKRVISAEEIE